MKYQPIIGTMRVGDTQSVAYPVALVATLVLSLLGCTAEQAQDTLAS